MTFYKIRNRRTGLFSKGGQINNMAGDVLWSKHGKTWDTIGKLRSHISQHLPSKYNAGTDMSEWEVVEYHVTEQPAKGIHEIISHDKLIGLITR